MANLSRQSNGHLSRVSGGELGKCAACVECDWCGSDEPGCPDASCHTPNRISVVLNAALSSLHGASCQTCGVGGGVWDIPGGGDTFDAIEITDVTSTAAFNLRLDQDGPVCAWINNDVGSITIRFCEECDGGNCSGTTATVTLTLKAILFKTSNTAWKFAIHADPPSTSVVDSDDWAGMDSTGELTGAILGVSQLHTGRSAYCEPTLTMNNGITDAGCESDDVGQIIFDKWRSFTSYTTATLEPCG